MKKVVFLIILVFSSALIGLGFYFDISEVQDDPSDIDSEPEKEEVEKPDLNIPEEPFFDYKEDNLSNLGDTEGDVESNNKTVKAVYFTSYSASSERKIKELINIASTTEINAVVIDVNNFSGTLAYDSEISAVNEYNLDSQKINNIESLVDRLHENDIYVIARLVVFQNTALAKARPDFALLSSSTKDIWYDSAEQGWLDPASEEARRFIVEVSKEVFSFGFDEVNYDYIRFPSDGNLDDIHFPVWDRKTLKTEVLSNVFSYLRSNLPGKKLSIDLFGLTTVNRDGLGIGQLLEDAYDSFDVISPMIYPSHYADGSFGIKSPAHKPYEIILVSLVNSVIRIPGINSLEDYASGQSEVEIRPWLQDFDVGANYGPGEVRDQINATYDALGDSAGFMLWNSRNEYTWDALLRE